MAIYGVSFTLNYVAWDTANNAGKTGDAANHTLRWIKDGTSAAPTNSPVEVDATNAPGVYKLTLTATEAQATYGTLAGKSSTSGVSIMPVSVAFERLPNVSPGSVGGLPVLNANTRIDADALSLSTSAANTVWQNSTRTLTSATNITSDGQTIDQSKLANLDATVSSRLASSAYTPPPSSSVIAAAVWDESRSGHNTTGTYGAVTEWASALTAAGVWTYGTRALTSASGITSDGQPIDQAKLANLDTSVSSRAPASTALSNAIWTDAKAGFLDAAVSSRLSSSDIPTIVTNVFSNTIETGITFKNLCQVLGSVIAGQISTAGTDTEIFKAINNSSTTRVTVSVDSSGNRSNVTFNL